LRRERVPLDAVSVLIQEAGSGATQLTLNARKPSTRLAGQAADHYAALDQLGPAFTWKTPVWLAGNVVRRRKAACSRAMSTCRAAAIPS